MSDAYSILRKQTNAEIAALKAKLAEAEKLVGKYLHRWSWEDAGPEK